MENGHNMGIANYGSFRAGIRAIIQDSKNFSEYVVEQLEYDPEIHVIDIFKRTG
jgi:hypothetical protein